MGSTLGYAILGLLAREACSGYDLTQQMKLRVGSFWQAQHSQIYPELARLEVKGLVSHERIEQEDRPDKKVYAITETGRSALKSWVDAPGDLPCRRDEFLVKVFSMWLSDPHLAVTELRRHGEFHRQHQRHYEQHIAMKFKDGEPSFPSPLFASYLGMQRGLSYEREYADWCEWAAALIEQQAGLGKEA